MWGLLLLCGLAVGLCGSVIIVGLRLSRPARARIGSPPDTLSEAETVAFMSASGVSVRGWWLPGQQPGTGTVVLMHGAWANRLRMVRRAAILRDHGFAVLLFDFQAHGESGGEGVTYGWRESFDAAAAVEFVRQRLPGERVGVIGVSLGGAAALLGQGPLKVDAFVLESVYPDIDRALANRLRTSLGRFAGALFTPLLVAAFKLLLPPLLGVRAGHLRPVDRIGGIAAPLLLVSGSADRRTPVHEARVLFDAAPEPKRFWVVEGAAHVDLEAHNPDEYWRVVLQFLEGALRTPR
jgi:alpha-beta hydrolase superfamily lysophospholipase